jgi:hypothetical protein
LVKIKCHSFEIGNILFHIQYTVVFVFFVDCLCLICLLARHALHDVFSKSFSFFSFVFIFCFFFFFLFFLLVFFFFCQKTQSTLETTNGDLVAKRETSFLKFELLLFTFNFIEQRNNNFNQQKFNLSTPFSMAGRLQRTGAGRRHVDKQKADDRPILIGEKLFMGSMQAVRRS